jgi:RNA polymerase sigma factor (sigma-70 family)
MSQAPESTHSTAARRRAGDVDLGELYLALSPRLERIVRLDVRAPDVVIEDACQFAWSRLLYHRDRVGHDSALSWLAKTAVHEAVKLVRRDQRELSLEGERERELERPGRPLGRSLAPGPEEHFEQRQRLDALAGLPERQQRTLWLHALGLSYAEIGLQTGDTPRTVERQLLRARRTVRGLAA